LADPSPSRWLRLSSVASWISLVIAIGISVSGYLAFGFSVREVVSNNICPSLIFEKYICVHMTAMQLTLLSLWVRFGGVLPIDLYQKLAWLISCFRGFTLLLLLFAVHQFTPSDALLLLSITQRGRVGSQIHGARLFR
jgi:hypothetical protein